MPPAGAATLAVARRDLGVQVTFRSMTRELVTSDLADAWSQRFESLPPVRVPPGAFKGQRNFAGSWWFATTQGHVASESWLERDHLMLLDFAPEVVVVAAQPFTAALSTPTGPRNHTPDYFVRMADGTGVVIDVRPDARAAEELDQAVEDSVARLRGQAAPANRKMLNSAEEDPDAFRRYMAEFSLEQAQRLDSAAALTKVDRFTEKSARGSARLGAAPPDLQVTPVLP